MGKKKGKKDQKGKGAEKTAMKTERKADRKTKKLLQEKGEEDIEALIAEFQERDRKQGQVVETKCSPPSARSNMTLNVHPGDKDELVMFGGEFFNGNRTFLYNDLFFYNLKTNEWTQLKAAGAPPPRCAHQAVALKQAGGQLWIFGGEFASPTQSQFYHYKDLWVFHFKDTRWEKISVAGGPSARSGHRMVACKKQLIVFGGFHDNVRNYKYFNDVYAFNLEKYTWTRLEPSGVPPSPRSGCVMAVTHDQKRLVVYGGYSKEKIKKDVDLGKTHTDMFVLTPESKSKQDTAPTKWKWMVQKQSGVKPTPRSGCSLVATPGNRAIVFGGVFDEEEDDETVNGVFYDEMYSLELDKGKWHEVFLKQKKDKDKKPRRRKKDASATAEGDDDMEGEEDEGDTEEEMEEEVKNLKVEDEEVKDMNVDNDEEVKDTQVEEEEVKDIKIDEVKDIKIDEVKDIKVDDEVKDIKVDDKVKDIKVDHEVKDIKVDDVKDLKIEKEVKDTNVDEIKDTKVEVKDTKVGEEVKDLKVDDEAKNLEVKDDDVKKAEDRESKSSHPSTDKPECSNAPALVDDGIFTVTMGPQGVGDATTSATSATAVFRGNVFVPRARMNPLMAVHRGILYLYGGIYEEGDKQVTLTDMYSLDLHRLDKWKTLIACDAESQEWQESDSDDDEDDDDDDDDDEEAGAPNAALGGDSDSDSDDEDDEDSDEEMDMDDAPSVTPGESFQDYFIQNAEYWLGRAIVLAKKEGLVPSAIQLKKAAQKMSTEFHQQS